MKPSSSSSDLLLTFSLLFIMIGLAVSHNNIRDLPLTFSLLFIIIGLASISQNSKGAPVIIDQSTGTGWPCHEFSRCSNDGSKNVSGRTPGSGNTGGTKRIHPIQTPNSNDTGGAPTISPTNTPNNKQKKNNNTTGAPTISPTNTPNNNNTGGAPTISPTNTPNNNNVTGRDATDIIQKHNNATGSKSKLKLTPIFIGLGVAVIVLVSAICFIVLRFKGKSLSILLPHGKKNDNARIEAFITKFGSFAPSRYSYAEIKKITNKFKDKLGQGGFGGVYKGKLPDGRLVAVKVLSGTKGNGEDFMNEVASISRTAHVNIVTLLGFCLERSKRALIYEFMLHGSLDKFIYCQGPDNQRRQLEWKTLFDIALGIARGLEYLHQGCNTRILHFDIKPHNILLDEDFCPKIADFGLSKLCGRKESVISMTGARGTAGYIAPEVFSRSLGGVSHKSDVYSYGMMVLEMVGGRRNIDVEASETSEIYYPSWIYKRLDQSMNLNLNEEITEENEIKKKLIAVSLSCIQTNPLDRPSITKVLEMLQGSVESLVLPPRPP